MRAASLMAVVSAAGDFAKGYAEEQALRTCRIGMLLADRAGLSQPDRQAVFYLCLLRFVGCTATASQMAAALGDELAVSAAFASVDTSDLPSVVRAAGRLVTGSPVRRAVGVARFMVAAPSVIREHEVASCEVAALFAQSAGLPERVRAGLRQVFERWDGHGHPGAAGGRDISLPVRVEQVAHASEVLVRELGWDAAIGELRRRAAVERAVGAGAAASVRVGTGAVPLPCAG